MNVFKERRAKLASELASVGGASAVVLWAHPEQLRNDDVHHLYKPDSNLFYLTGWEEPESVLVFRPGMEPESTLFVRDKDPARETWEGFRYGPAAAKSEFGMGETHLMSEFESKFVGLLKGCDRLYYRFGTDQLRDLRMLALMDRVRETHGRSGRGLLPIHDSKELLGKLRVIKSAADVGFLREACEISTRGHVKAMAFTRPGMNERQVMATVLHSFYMDGAAREGYPAIVASGDSATTLHYRFNDQPCRDGDLLLLDAGAETANGYTGDVTRTFPVNGKFSAPQRSVYEAVLRVQKSLIAMAKPGAAFRSLMDHAIEALTDEMRELGLLKGARQELIDSLAFRRYYPHGMGHFLGMDVHDSGLYNVDGQSEKHSRLLEPGMCFTVEPGLYVPASDESAPPELRGIGVRIEDNVVVTEAGCEVLTGGAPKEISEIEALMRPSKA